MKLSEQQVAFFRTFGYLALPGLFADEIDQISTHFDALFENHKDDVVNWIHAVHDNKERRFISGVTEKDPYLAGIAEDSRIRDIAESLLGEGCEFRGSDASIYDCGTSFHQDDYGVARRTSLNLKMALYLDPVDEKTGAIRLIPGSHHLGDQFAGLLNRDLWLSPENLGLSVEEVPATVLPSVPGDLMIWNYRVLHATIYGGNRRRMFALEFGES